MGKTIDWTTTIKVVGGPTLSFSKQIELEGYAQFSVEIAAETVDQQVELSPDAEGLVQFLAVRAGGSDPAAEAITYKVGDDDTEYSLDAPHVYAGAGQLAGLGTVNALKFTNTNNAAVPVEILVGRYATVE